MLAKATTHRFAVGVVIVLASVLVAGTSVAQSTSGYDNGSTGPMYHPVHSYPAGWGFGYYRASTAAEGFLRGRAAVIDAIGNFEVNDSQAAILSEQARALDRENNLKQTEALLAQKKMWSDARIQARQDRDARSAAGREILAQREATIYRQAYQLSASELNLKTGELCWPAALQDAKFQENRVHMEELFRQCIAYGSPEPGTTAEIARSVDQWSRTLRNDIGSMPREEYLAAQKFLLGLKYGAASLVAST
jgi:hypothetical protein